MRFASAWSNNTNGCGTMAHTYSLGQARASSTGNPIAQSYTVNAGDTVVCLMLKTVGGTDRAGVAPDLGAAGTFVQANIPQKAAASPEAGCELWFLLNPTPGTYTLTIPNTGAATILYTVGVGRAASGKSTFVGANGGNGTSTNPTPGPIAVQEKNCIVFAITAGGWTTWAPSAQVGTAIANTDDGADGGGEQYSLSPAIGAFTLSWTFGTSDDWGAVAAAFGEVVCSLNNYMGVDVGSGMSCGEKIR